MNWRLITDLGFRFPVPVIEFILGFRAITLDLRARVASCWKHRIELSKLLKRPPATYLSISACENERIEGLLGRLFFGPGDSVRNYRASLTCISGEHPKHNMYFQKRVFSKVCRWWRSDFFNAGASSNNKWRKSEKTCRRNCTIQEFFGKVSIQYRSDRRIRLYTEFQMHEEF